MLLSSAQQINIQWHCKPQNWSFGRQPIVSTIAWFSATHTTAVVVTAAAVACRFCSVLVHLWFRSASLPILPHWAPLFGDCNFQMIIRARSCWQLSSLQQAMVLHKLFFFFLSCPGTLFTVPFESVARAPVAAHTFSMSLAQWLTGARCLMAGTSAAAIHHRFHSCCSVHLSIVVAFHWCSFCPSCFFLCLPIVSGSNWQTQLAPILQSGKYVLFVSVTLHVMHLITIKCMCLLIVVFPFPPFTLRVPLRPLSNQFASMSIQFAPIVSTIEMQI